MEKKMAGKSVERPTFFEIFKERCSESDLGPINLNWFDELSSAVPSYESETSDEPEYRNGWLDQSTSETPRGKPSMYSQLASTPMIFKEQSATLPLLSSPIKELGQKTIEAGKDSLATKEHRTSPHVTKTKLDQANETSLNTSLSASPAVLRGIYRTPCRNDVSVASGSLLCTPKLLEVTTTKCISESLGAEVDPDMSWSSSLATPPTLNATVIIAGGNDSVSGTKQHNERIAMVLHNFFFSHGKRPGMNDINVLSIPQTVNVDADAHVKDHELEKMLDGSFGEMTILEDRFHIRVKSSGNQMVPNAPKDGESHEMTIDIPDEGNHVFTICHTSGKGGSLQEMTTCNGTEKTHIDKMRTVLFQDTNEVRENFEDACFIRCEGELNYPTTNILNNRIRKPSENRRFTREDMPSSLTSEWSQLNLSGLDVTQLEKMSTSDTRSPPSFCSKKRSEDTLAFLTPKDATLETSLLNTSSLVKAEKGLKNTLSEDREDETETNEKHSTSETSLTRSVFWSGQDSPLKEGCADEEVSKVNFLDCSSLKRNTNFTEYPEVPNNCFNKHLKECSKSSVIDVTSHPLVCNASTPTNPAGTKWSSNSESTPMRSGLKSTSVLSSLKKRPKRFIYTIKSVSPYHKEKVKKEIKADSSIHSASSHSEFESCNFKGPDTTSNDDQGLLVSSTERSRLQSDTDEATMRLNRYAKRADRIDNSAVSSLGNRMIHENLKDVLKDDRKGHQPSSSLDCSETSNTQKDYFVVSSNSKSVLGIKHKVISTACLLAKKHSKMDFGGLENVIQSPKKDEIDMYRNVNSNNDTIMQAGDPSSDNGSEHLIETEQKRVSKKNCNFSDTLSEINLDISKHNSVHCNKEKSVEENGFTSHLPIEQWKAVTLPSLVIQPDKNTLTSLNRKRKTDIVPFSKVIAADQETESTEDDENKLQTATNKTTAATESVKNLFDDKDCSSLQAAISEKSTLPKLAVKIRREQMVSDFVTQDSVPTRAQQARLMYLSKEVPQPNVEEKHCIKKVIKYSVKHTASDKDLYSKNPLCLDSKSKGNPEDTGKWSGHTSFNGHSLNESFGGFQTASNKQIKLSENSITKGKMLFKDIECVCVEDFSREEIKNISNQITKENVKISPVVDNILGINHSCSSDSQASLVEPKNAQGILSESTDSSLQNLPRNQQPQLNQTLTASQEAEITELSNILEETGSQYEFTQFRKQNDKVQNNSSELSGCVVTNEITNLKSILDFDANFRTKDQIVSDKSYNKHEDKNEDSTVMGNVKEEKKVFQKNNSDVFTSANLCGNANMTSLVPSFLVPSLDSFSNFGGFSSAAGEKINISNEALIRSAKLFSNMDEDGKMFKSTDDNLRSCCSHRPMTSTRNASGCGTEDDDCIQSIKDANAEYQSTLKNNEENINKIMKIYTDNQAKIKNVDENLHISTSTRINNVKVIKCSIHKMEDALSLSENHNHSLHISKNLNEIDTQTQCNLQESLSDLTCLSEASKTEEILTLNILSETELDLDKNEQKIKHPDDFQTTSSSNVLVSQTPMDKLFLFETCTEKVTDNVSLNSNRQMTSINKKIIYATSVGEDTNVNENKSKIASEHQKVFIQRKTDFEIKNIKQNNMMGFHTASGKKVTITDKSMAKAKQLFAEENVFMESKHNIGNFENSEFQALKKEKCNKEFIKDCDLFADSIPKYKNMLNCTGNLVSKELKDASEKIFDHSTIKHQVDVETLEELSVEVHLSANLDKRPEEYSKASFSKKPDDVVFEKSDLGFYIGDGKNNSVSETSLFEARKLFVERNQENTTRKNVFSERTSIVPAFDHTSTDLHLKEMSDILEEHPTCFSENSSFHLKDDNKVSDFQPTDDSSQDVNCFPENMDSVSIDQPLVSLVADKNNLISSEETSQNESSVNQNCDSEFVDASSVLKISATEVAGSNLKFNDGPFAFSTARGKTVTVSYDALKTVRQMFPEKSNKSLKYNNETKSEALQVEITANCSETLDNDNCSTSTNSLTVETNETRNSIMCHFPNAKENSYEGGQALQYNKNTSSDLWSHPCPQTSYFQVNDAFRSNELNHQSDFSTGNYAFFSTASGKRVQLSEDSLKKARCLFSEVEVDNHKLSDQQCVSEPKCGYAVSSLGDQVVKCVGTGGVLVLSKSEVVISQEKRFRNPDQISNTAFGFSTASGKQVLVSESAFQKAKQVFDDIPNSKFCFENQLSSRQEPVTSLNSFANCVGANKTTDEASLKSKPQGPPNEELNLKNNCPVEMKPLRNICNIKIPVCEPHSGKDEHQTLFKNSFTSAEETQGFEKEQHNLSRMQMEAEADSSSRPVKAKLDVYQVTCCQNSENYLETEAVESAKAFMEDDKLINSGVENKAKRCRKHDKNSPLCRRIGKRLLDENSLLGDPPIKRQLLPEFDRISNHRKSLEASKSTPDGTIKDRRKFIYHIPLKPETCGPFSATKEHHKIKNPNLTLSHQGFEGLKSGSGIFQHHVLRQSSSDTSSFLIPCNNISTEESEKRKNLPVLSKTAKAFVPPFKVKSNVSTNEKHGRKSLDSLMNRNMNRDKELKDTTRQHNPGVAADYQSEEKDCTKQATAHSLENTGDGDSDLMEMLANLNCARSLQEMRIRKKQRQNIHPQPGSLYLLKTSGAKKISLKAAVKEKSPKTYSIEQLYMYGVSKHCVEVNSINAESFQFLIQDFFSKEYLLAGHGIQLADGGWLIPSDSGKAGKEEFYRALCDTPGVDPKLITEAWVYNHYRWIVWKLAAMEVSFPQEFANRSLTPERVLFQLKYRYDLEIDKSQRSAIKKILERDDTAAKTLILCISKIISLNANIPDTCSNKNSVESKKEVAMIEVTDGWYGVKAVLDPPLQALLRRGRLMVGQKIIVHGAELMGSQDACTPLEIPVSLMLKISANSTRCARWHAKLGFHRDPRPFPLPLSSLFSEGGIVGCIDVVIQRAYPIQWVEKMPNGSYVFRNSRAEEREAVKHAENRQKSLEALFSQIQVEFEQHEDKPRRALRSHTLTRQKIHTLQDGAELYEAIQNASDPGYMEGYFSEEQLKALNAHRQMLNDKKQALIQAEFKKALESAEREEQGCAKRDVSTVWKLRVTDYRKQEEDKAIILNIWRPLSDVCSLLKEGGRYRIYQLAASQSKGKSDTANVQLTATRKTQYLQLQASQEELLQIYIPRKALQFSMLLDPSFQLACAEVDLVGFIVSVSKRTGFATLVYLSDEDYNLVAIKIWKDLKQLAIEDIVNPYTLISASNLQWRSEFKSEIPTLLAGDLSIFSASPKDRYLQERLNKLKSTIQNVNCFCNDAELKLMDLLQTNDPQPRNLLKECGLDHLSPSWKSGPDAGNKCLNSSPNSNIKLQSSLAARKQELKLVPQSSAKVTPHIPFSEESARNCKKRKALDLLIQIPSPPPVTPICSFVSPSLKKAFQPPRSSGIRCNRSPKGTDHNSDPFTPSTRANETAPLPERDLVADEELAMINTQVLLCNMPEEKVIYCVAETTSTMSSDPTDHLLLRTNSPESAAKTETSQNSTDGAQALGKDTRETERSLAVRKKLQRRRKRKCY